MNQQVNPRFDGVDHTAIRLAKSGSTPRPTVLEIHPSPICQLGCAYCHSMSSPLDKTIYSSGKRLLAVEEYAQIFEEFVSLGGTEVVISGGGEPLLYPNIIDLIEAASHVGLRIHIYTNGLTKRYFLVESLELWLPKITSVRFSLHYSTGPQRMPDVLTAIHNTVSCRNHLMLQVKVHTAVLVDTYPRTELERLLTQIAAGNSDCIELRIVIPPSRVATQVLHESIRFLREIGCEDSRISTRMSADSMPLVPSKCFSLYRNIVIDPYGGFRLCCMRAHYPETDFSYIGSVHEISLSVALSAGVKQMALAGSGACDVCSVRDSYFSAMVARTENCYET